MTSPVQRAVHNGLDHPGLVDAHGNPLGQPPIDMGLSALSLITQLADMPDFTAALVAMRDTLKQPSAGQETSIQATAQVAEFQRLAKGFVRRRAREVRGNGPSAG